MRRALLILFWCVVAGTAAQAAQPERDTISFGNTDRTYYRYVPDNAGGRPPVLVLLHGTGGNGLFMLVLWKGMADREGIALIAPDSLHRDIGWDLRYDGPDYIHAVLGDAAARHPYDPRRIYVFGQSGGATFALNLGLLESGYFAAVAYHAGGWRHPDEYRVLGYATRKIPIATYVGDADEYFSMAAMRRTEQLLTGAGIPATLTVFPGRHHSILDVPPDFESTVWDFLKQQSLSEPNYTAYRGTADNPD